MYGCRILCMFYMREMTYHTSMYVYNAVYLHACGCTVCWRATLACFSQAHALSFAFSTRPEWCTVWFSSMAILKLSNWSACRYIHSGLGPSGMKYTPLLAKCHYSRCRYTGRFCVAVNREKFRARIQRRYKRYVVIPDVDISEVYCTKIWHDNRYDMGRKAHTILRNYSHLFKPVLHATIKHTISWHSIA